ncbi:hypothetical protein [Phycicoccus duodecadis]|uniref:Uncharacterized protein n=1 Tax=Phycicoccus duodecadis TaxID=173053 RepID=A0A2N3YGZ1_9MICO|nr:hypothetical protein [Phycicoccus duodecadis]PKW26100.1 hypothetical protein ATL31_0905 [Phycicoccus duodecadis]
MSARRPAARTLLALPAGLALLVGMDAGLGLLDAWPPVGSARLGDVHGILMVFGFVGTLVALERAVALGRPVGYAAPALLGLGAVLLVPEPTRAVGAALLTAGSLALCLVYVPLWHRNRDDAVLVSALGAVCALGGAVLWRAGADTSQTIPWLAGFVILTIGGERLELARLAMPPTAGRDLVLLSSGLASAVVAATLWPAVGTPLLGVALLALTAWLVRHDVARRTVRSSGLPRFAAGCMLAGQAWLVVAGGIWLLGGTTAGGARYDAVVHAVFLGFTISMIMAHASSILPAVTRVPLPYRPVMYGPWGLLQLSLVLRLWGGDALGSEMARRLGGAGNALALLLFLVVAVGSAVRGAPARPRRVPAAATAVASS